VLRKEVPIYLWILASFKNLSVILLLLAVTVFGCSSRKSNVEIPTNDVDDIIHNPQQAVEYTEPPIQIEAVKPIYPYHAERDGITGTVWLQALIDSTGKVADVRIAKDSGKNAGFEEAAVTAARKTKWAPAKNNDRPVSIWVTYKVEFDLK
jgi:TonB family protein